MNIHYLYNVVHSEITSCLEQSSPQITLTSRKTSIFTLFPYQFWEGRVILYNLVNLVIFHPIPTHLWQWHRAPSVSKQGRHIKYSGKTRTRPSSTNWGEWVWVWECVCVCVSVLKDEIWKSGNQVLTLHSVRTDHKGWSFSFLWLCLPSYKKGVGLNDFCSLLQLSNPHITSKESECSWVIWR